MNIERVTKVDMSLVKEFERLIPQLIDKEEYPSYERLKAVVESDNTQLLVAIDNGNVIGTLTLIFNQIPSGLRVWIEDVVVDKEARGKGVGTALIQYALKSARDNGAEKVDLFSHPRRIAANRLYQRAGFEIRESNPYRYHFTDDRQTK